MTDDNSGEDKCAAIRKAVTETSPGDQKRRAAIVQLAVENGCVNVIPDDWELPDVDLAEKQD